MIQHLHKRYLCQHFVFALLCYLLFGVASTQTVQAQVSFVFSYPSIPSSLTSVDDRATYLVTHYWDNAIFLPSLSTEEKDAVEQLWVNYCDLFRLTNTSTISQSMTQLMSSKSVPPTIFMSLAEKYLFSTDSPYHNDEAYMVALESFLHRDDTDSLYKQRFTTHHHMLTNCREGVKVADFRFKTENGYSSLYEISLHHTLLLLYDPDCDHCQEIMEWLSNDTHVANMLAENKLNILSVNITATSPQTSSLYNQDKWLNIQGTLPDIVASNKFDLRMLPLCLLLDSNHKIIYKTNNRILLEKHLKALLELRK